LDMDFQPDHRLIAPNHFRRSEFRNGGRHYGYYRPRSAGWFATWDEGLRAGTTNRVAATGRTSRLRRRFGSAGRAAAPDGIPPFAGQLLSNGCSQVRGLKSTPITPYHRRPFAGTPDGGVARLQSPGMAPRDQQTGSVKSYDDSQVQRSIH
jgi:hypothetical protein